MWIFCISNMFVFERVSKYELVSVWKLFNLRDLWLRVKSTLNIGCCTLILFCYPQHNYWIKSPFKLLIRWFQAKQANWIWLIFADDLTITCVTTGNSLHQIVSFEHNFLTDESHQLRKFCYHEQNCNSSLIILAFELNLNTP